MAKLSAALMLNFLLLFLTAPVLALPEWYTFWAKDTDDCHRLKDGLPEWPKKNADFTTRLRHDANKGTVSSSAGHTWVILATYFPGLPESSRILLKMSTGSLK